MESKEHGKDNRTNKASGQKTPTLTKAEAEAEEAISEMECEAKEPTLVQEETIQAISIKEEGLVGETTCTSPPSSNQEQLTATNLPSKDEVKAEFMAVTIKSMNGLVNLVANFDTSKDCRENDYLVSYCCIFETLINIANYEYMEDGYFQLGDIRKKIDWIQSETNPQYGQNQEPLYLPPTQDKEE